MISYSNYSHHNRKNPVWKTRFLIILLCLLGLVDTGVLLYNHFYFQNQCQILPFGISFLGNDCGDVTSSSYGTWFGFPLSLWGAIGYSLTLTFTLMSFANRTYFWGTLVLTSFGTAASWVLLGVQYYIIKKFCPLCLLSLGLETSIFLTAWIAFLFLTPPLPSWRQTLIIISTAGWLGTSGLLGYKIFQDKISFQPEPVATTLTTIEDSNPATSSIIKSDFPAGMIEDQIIFLFQLDDFIQENLSPEKWESLTENQNQMAIQELRRRALYLLGIDRLAEEMSSSAQEVLDLALGVGVEGGKKSDWNAFITDFFSLDGILTQAALKGNDSGQEDDRLSKIQLYLTNRIRIQENIPFTGNQ